MSSRGLFDIRGRNALVTGGNKGLGKGISYSLAEAGVNIAIAAREFAATEEICKDIRDSYSVEALPIRADVRVSRDVDEMVSATIGRFGHIDILVSNAGITNHPRQNAWEIPDEVWNEIFDVNLKGMYMVCARAARTMITHKRGKIICMASMVSLVAQPGHAPYVASKGGIAQLTRALALDLAPHNIQVNALAPGYFRSNMTEASLRNESKMRGILEDVPLGRIGEPEDLAGATIFLASSASDMITGHVLVIDGGYTTK